MLVTFLSKLKTDILNEFDSALYWTGFIRKSLFLSLRKKSYQKGFDEGCKISQALTGRIKQLAERYAEPLPQLAANVAAFNAKVEVHLKKMGFAL